MEPPPGYPPPTLIRRKSRGRGIGFAVGILLLFAGLGFYIVNRLLDDTPAAPPLPPVETQASGADAPAASVHDTEEPAAAAPQVIVEQPVATTTADAPDGRKPNQWYFVRRLGDGPGAIYSRDGGQWDFAFACTTSSRTIEFIAVGIGSPGTFVDQQINVGKTRLMMDAVYSKDAGGMISTTLPASHSFFTTLLEKGATMEIQLLADRKTIVPVGPGVVRLIRECRGRS